MRRSVVAVVDTPGKGALSGTFPTERLWRSRLSSNATVFKM